MPLTHINSKGMLLLKLLSCNRVKGLKAILKSYSAVPDMQYLLVLLSLQILKTTSETATKITAVKFHIELGAQVGKGPYRRDLVPNH